MTEPSYSIRRYLESVRTVDDRAASRRVLARLARELDGLDGPRVLDVGAGLGAMAERLAGRGLLPDGTRYVAVEKDPDFAAAARERLLDGPAVARDDGLEIERGGRRVAVDVVVADAYGLLDRGWDLLVVQAFPHSGDVSALVERLFAGLSSGGACYVPVAFDGGTAFAPGAALDARIERRYHERLDEGGGNSRLGRRLLGAARAAGGRVLAADGADRVVVPCDGGYPDDEAYFIHHVVESIRGTLAGTDLAGERFDDWVATRHGQIEAGELSYVAHGLDLLIGE